MFQCVDAGLCEWGDLSGVVTYEGVSRGVLTMRDVYDMLEGLLMKLEYETRAADKARADADRR